MSSERDAQWSELASAFDRDDPSTAAQLLDNMVTEARHESLPLGGGQLIELSAGLESCDDRICAATWRLSTWSAHDMKVSVTLADLRAMGLANEYVLNAVAYAIAAECRGRPQIPWRPHLVGSAQVPDDDVMDARLLGYRMMESDEEVERHLENGRDVLLFGQVGAGKTTAATRQASQWGHSERGLIWVDLTDPHDVDESVAYALILMRRVELVLLVIDNVQANLTAARGIIDLVRQLRARAGIPIVILATGTPSVAREELQLGLTPVSADGHVLVRTILSDIDEMTAEQKSRVERLAEGDAVIAGIAVDLWRGSSDIPEVLEFANLVADKLHVDSVSEDAQRLLYKIACLALFEIELNRREIANVERHALDELREARLVELNDESYTIGPRSLARLLVQHAYQSWGRATPLVAPDRLAYDHLQRAGAAQIRATLDRLDLLPFDREKPEERTGLASAWGALGFLADSLSRRAMEDPTWGDEVSSAAFASMALIDLGREDAWQKSAEFVRDRWTYEGEDDLPLWDGEGPSADLEAFQRMSALMQAEEELIRADLAGSGEPSEPLNAELACRTWMLGILLSLEAKAPDRSAERVDRLVRSAQRVIRDGPFYPREAPWITAQLILGLSLAGRNARNDPAVQRACRWLCEDQKFGGAYNNGWQNGVSGKTADAMTTALCLSALLHAGWQNPERLSTAYQSLCAEQDLLEPSGQETELALIVEARLRNGDEWEELSPVIFNLLSWAIHAGRSRDGNVKASRPGDPFSASAKAPFIAVQLWIIIWTAVKRELRQLLQDVHGLRAFSGAGHGTLGLSTYGPDSGQSVGDVSRNGAGVTMVLRGRAIRRSVDRLRREIEENISERARQLRGLRESAQDPFERNLQIWQDRLRRLEIIDAELELDGSSAEVVARLNALGRDVFDIGWQPITGDN